MKATFISILLLLSTLFGVSQNLIQNPDFELGTIPTLPGQIHHAAGWSQPCTDAWMYTGGQKGADLFDRNATNPDVQVPNNNYTFGFDLDERDGDNRYAHLWQTENANTGAGGAPQLKGERITGTLTETLGAGCYDLSFWGAVMPHDATILPGVFVDYNPMNSFDLDKQKMEVLLVNGNNCSGLVLFETPAIPDDGDWHQYSTNFSLTAAQAGMYNRVLFRIKDDGAVSANQFSIFLDETELYNTNTTISISGDTTLCAGSTTTLYAAGGYDNYLWSNGATSSSITVGSGGTYTLTAWNDGDDCPSTGSITVTTILAPKIKLPKKIYVCNENFEALCGPSNTGIYSFTYSWYFNDPGTMTSILVSNNQCYVPNQYGSYTLIVENQYGCTSSHTINVVEAFGPEISIKNVTYCKAAPHGIGLPGPYADASAYVWTYDDGSGPVIVPGATGYQIPNMGDGVYCVTIHWNNDNEPSLLGCTSTACFTVEQCCKPDPAFILNYDPTGATATITVQNNPTNALDYDSEQFVLYQYCGSETDLNLVPWTPIVTTPWNTNFLTPVVFSGLDKNCIYKVVHHVNKECIGKVFVSEQLAGLLKITLYPNAVEKNEPLTVAMSSLSPQAEVSIINMISGRVVYTGTLTYERPLKVPYRTFVDGPGVYIVKVVNELGTITERVIVK